MGRFSKRLGDKLRDMRGEATLREFAPTLGLNAQALYRIESGEQNVTLDTLETICNHLDCKAGDLIDEGGKFAPRTEKAPKKKTASRVKKPS